MPEAIAKLDAALVNAVCNDIIETSGSIQWDDIAGMCPPALFSAHSWSCQQRAIQTRGACNNI